MDLPAAMSFTGTLMMALVYTGYALLVSQLCRRRGARFLAFFLLFLNGGLVRSSSFVGGTELEWITKITTFPQNPFALVRTPEGNVELAARYLTGLYSYTGVRHIAFYSSMIPDQADILKKMGEFIPEKYLPEIVKVNSVRDYLYEGALYSI
jgi:hypothetical protein